MAKEKTLYIALNRKDAHSLSKKHNVPFHQIAMVLDYDRLRPKYRNVVYSNKAKRFIREAKK